MKGEAFNKVPGSARGQQEQQERGDSWWVQWSSRFPASHVNHPVVFGCSVSPKYMRAPARKLSYSDLRTAEP